jgi:hypothetical protein
LKGACEPSYCWSRKIAADDEDAARRTRQRGQDIPAGSNRSLFHNIRSATAIAARLAEPECSSSEGGEEDESYEERFPTGHAVGAIAVRSFQPHDL